MKLQPIRFGWKGDSKVVCTCKSKRADDYCLNCLRDSKHLMIPFIPEALPKMLSCAADNQEERALVHAANSAAAISHSGAATIRCQVSSRLPTPCMTAN